MHKPDDVVKAMVAALSHLGNAGRGTGASALEAARIEYRTRQMLSELFYGEGAKHIAFALNATEALNTALFGTLTEKDHVITTVTEHNSVLRPLYRIGCPLDFLPVDGEQIVDLSRLEGFLREDTKAVVVNHASNVTGNVLDLERVGAFCKAHDLLFIVDASQTAGHTPSTFRRQASTFSPSPATNLLWGHRAPGGFTWRRASTWSR